MTVKLFPAFTLTGSTNIVTGTLEEFETNPASFHITTGSYFLCFSGTVGNVTYENFCQRLGEALTSASANTGGGFTYDVQYNDSQDRIIILKNGSNIQITASNDFTKHILGFTTTIVTTDTQAITGTLQPSHVWVSTYGQLSEPDSELFEAGPIYVDAIADDGTAYSIGRTAAPKHREWQITTEPTENIYSGYRDGPWAFEDFISHVRSVKPWGFVTGSNNGIVSGSDVIDCFRIRAEASHFNPRRTMSNLSSYWNHDLMARWVSSSL